MCSTNLSRSDRFFVSVGMVSGQSLLIYAIMVRWLFGTLARRLLVYLLQQALLRQDLPDSGDGGATTTARLRLVSVFVVVSRWSIGLFVFFITFRVLCTALDAD